MEELKMIIKMITDLPEAALWVVAALLVYKLSIMASIYGVIRFVVQKTHDVIVHKKSYVEPPALVQKIEYDQSVNGITINAEQGELMNCIRRFINITTVSNPSRSNFRSTYIHNHDIAWVNAAIDEKLQNERLANEERARLKERTIDHGERS